MDDRTLFETYSRDVFRLCLYMTRSRADAEDLCQEVFVTALLQDRSTIEHHRAWLMRLAVNRCNSWLARRQRGIVKERLMYLLNRSEPHDDVERAALDRETAGELGVLYGRLPSKIRAAMVLRYVNGLSLHEAADILDVPVGTVKSRLNRGLTLMRRMLDMPKYRHLKGEECYE